MKDRLFSEILPFVSKPARYTGGEVNMIKKDWEKSRVKMLLAFPDVYEVGMSHVGSKILYGLVNERSNDLAERAFAPWPDMEALMREAGMPLYSLESFRPARDFDIVGFSLQYELSITNILNMLDLAGIPVLSRERTESDPIVIAGGPVVFNPEPFADFIDAFLIGDGEEVLLEFMDVYHSSKDMNRKQSLLRLAAIPGVYIPALYQVAYNEDGTFREMVPMDEGVPERVRKRLVADLDTAYYPCEPIVPNLEIVHDRAVLEVMRGCQRGCRFCHAGIVYRPVRERSIQTLEKQAAEQLHNTGYDEISLTSLSTLDYSAVHSLVHRLVETYSNRGIGVSLPSLRVDAFSIDLANEVQKVRKTTLTLAPEAGTQRMRDIINKNVTEEQLFNAVEAAFKSGWLAIKLYFMIGLPGETEADLDGIIALMEKVREIGNRNAPRKVEIRGSLACFVPKAHTAFQWQPQNTMAELQEKINYMTRTRRKGIKLKFHDSKTSFIEGVIARGDRKIGAVILRAWEAGCKFDGWTDYFYFPTWMEAFDQCGIDPGFYSLRERSYEEHFPWDFIDTGVSREYLIRENERSRELITTGDCRQESCTGCGICPAFEVKLEIKEDPYATESRV